MLSDSNAKKFCKEDISLIENYELAIKDKESIYECHHRAETHTKNGKLRKVFISKQELIDKDKYYNRPAKELIFLTKSEHKSLHRKGIPRTEIERKNMSLARIGMKFSKEHCKHISDANINRAYKYECIETREIKSQSEWKLLGFHHVYEISQGYRKSEHGRTFKLVTGD